MTPCWIHVTYILKTQRGALERYPLSNMTILDFNKQEFQELSDSNGYTNIYIYINGGHKKNCSNSGLTIETVCPTLIGSKLFTYLIYIYSCWWCDIFSASLLRHIWWFLPKGIHPMLTSICSQATCQTLLENKNLTQIEVNIATFETTI